jgi:hypothetical protein
MIAWAIFFEDSDLIVNKLRLLHGKGANSGTPGRLTTVSYCNRYALL